MKKEQLFKSIADIKEEDVKKARQYRAKRKAVWIRWAAAAACAVIAATAIVSIPLLKKDDTDLLSSLTVMAAEYPKPTAANLSAQEFMEGDARWSWWESYRQLADESEKLQEGMNGYYAKVMEKLLVAGDDNTVCSPLNTYITFAMLAEVSEGNTRQQILDLLQVPDIETLRTSIRTIWEGNYVDTPVLKSLLANSLWLKEGYTYNHETMSRLAETYYASSYSGDPGSEEMGQALREWTDKNTGGLLSEQVKDMKLNPDTVLALVSTIYYKAMWGDEFSGQMTNQETFHGTLGDTTVDMMHKTDMMRVFSKEHFTALGLNLRDSGTMFFYLPNDGIDVNTLASDPEVTAVIREDEDEDWYAPEVHLSVPKFQVSCKMDLLTALEELGITDALDTALSDFTPLTEDREDLFLSKAEHTAMVEIDENGVTGAAYTKLEISEGAAKPDDEIDFVLNRPFLFVITGSDGSILFSGIVRNID